MKHRTTFLPRKIASPVFAAFLVALSFAAPAQSREPLPVVATFSILGDMVKNIGGANVSVAVLVGANGDTHIYQPTPADARAVGEAEVLFVNGLGFEGWIDRLVEASDFRGARIVAAEGIRPLENHRDEDDYHGHDNDDERDDKDHHEEHDKHAGHDHGVFDPHAWHDLANAVIYADNIAAALAKADPDNAAAFYRNRADYVAEMEALDAEIRARLNAIPEDKRTVVAPHDAFGYFAAAYRLTFETLQGISTESEPSAAEMAELIRHIREEEISAVFVETIADNRLIAQIARETGATVGGTLYTGALSGADGPASTYLKMMRHNATTIARALGR